MGVDLSFEKWSKSWLVEVIVNDYRGRFIAKLKSLRENRDSSSYQILGALLSINTGEISWKEDLEIAEYTMRASRISRRDEEVVIEGEDVESKAFSLVMDYAGRVYAFRRTNNEDTVKALDSLKSDLEGFASS